MSLSKSGVSVSPSASHPSPSQEVLSEEPLAGDRLGHSPSEGTPTLSAKRGSETLQHRLPGCLGMPFSG